MQDFADLEIGIEALNPGTFSVQLRFLQPRSDAEIRLSQRETSTFSPRLERLRELSWDPAAYGAELSSSLFAAPTLSTAFAQVRATARSLDVPLRVRLSLGAGAQALHHLRWESLSDPDAPSNPLFTDERTLFSRYLNSQDWRPVRLRPRAELRALVVIASPTNLSRFRPEGRELAPVDVDGELERARMALGNIPVTALASNGTATLSHLVGALRDGYDILYLVAHGAYLHDEARVWLEDDTGAAAITSGSEIITRLRELEHRPRLIVLASCQSSGDGSVSPLTVTAPFAALGPGLAESGIPAVVAMQGDISMATVARFMPAFFRELERDGHVDRAMAVARGGIRDRFDHWMPVLFMRLKSGRIWYNTGFADDGQGLTKWPALLRNIHAGRCTPILGAGLLESITGSQQQIARRWADLYQYPMAPQQQDELPLVAQYLEVHQDRRFMLDELRTAIRREIQLRFDAGLPPELRLDAAERPGLRMLVSEAARLRRQHSHSDPHHVLAGLPFPVYICTTPDSLLIEALKAHGKAPELELCRWNRYLEGLPSVFEREPGYRPTPERPLVYFMFGHLDEPDSLVVTVNDYFDFLLGFASNQHLIPAVITRALTDSALLLLGFHVDDWPFRALYRIVSSQEGSRRRHRYAHVAAQIDPEEGRILEPQQARRYLESYFQTADISVYWGTIEGFAAELQRRQGKTGE